MKNFDKKTINDFGREWERFNQSTNKNEINKIYHNYFDIFPFDKINKESIGFDAGCGSGRWAEFFVNKVKNIHCIEPSKDALKVAKNRLGKYKNVSYFNNTIDDHFTLNSTIYDFGFSLGVLHHIPNIELSLNKINNKLKKGSPFLIYLYYNFENRNFIFKSIWFISNFLRLIISNLPNKIKFIICDIIALIVYLPLSKINKIIKKFKLNIELPLYYYHDKSFYTMRTDSLDRFGTRLEKRFSKKQIISLLKKTGFKNIDFSQGKPFWVIICYKN